jgi:arylsulfatase A-like enzyme
MTTFTGKLCTTGRLAISVIIYTLILLLTEENGTTDPNGVAQLYASNFQAVSVAQKAFGYLNGSTSSAPIFGPNLTNALEFTDSRVGTLVSNLKTAGIYSNTLLIIGAKHGQSPINPSLSKLVDPSVLQNATTVQFAQVTADDGAYIWLVDPTIENVQKATSDLLASKTAGVASILSGSEVYQSGFGDPRLDPRVPDIIVISEVGIIYASVTAQKNMEHGGLNPDDLTVALFVHNPNIKGQVITERVYTRQVAVTAVLALGGPVSQLDGAQADGTVVLPGLNL